MKICVNLITLTRLISSIILVFLINKISNLAFIITAIIIFLTDTIDGYLARKYQVQTYLGSLLDALADKSLCITLIIPLIKITKYIYYILIMEIVISIINIIGKLTSRYIKSLLSGKIKMWIVSITIILGYLTLFYHLNHLPLIITCIITFIYQLYTSITYIKFLIKQKPRKVLKKYKLSYILLNTEYYLNNN